MRLTNWLSRISAHRPVSRSRRRFVSSRLEELEVRQLLTADFTGQQGYLLGAASNGVDAEYAWTQPGGTGRNVTVLDIEYATWNLDHEDLSAGAGAFLQNGTGRPFDFTDDHGTQVVGILVADDNGEGMTGIVHDADLLVMNHSNDAQNYLPSIQSAIERSTNVLDAGDVMIIEANMTGPGGTSVPVEYDEAIYNAIVAATSKGIIVLQTAGNDPTDLDLIPEFNGGRPDSGSIIVGAGQSPSNGANVLAAHSWTVHGSRVDLQGWGDNVASIGGHSGLNGASVNPCRSGIDANVNNASAQPCSDTTYTTQFGGTSGATPIVAGAAAAISSVAIEHGFLLSPQEVRELLINTGTAQNTNVNSDRQIGPLPNLRAALDTLSSTIVNQIGDTDDGDRSNGLTTLREAINVANSTPGEQTIRFDLPNGPQTITAASQLAITQSVRIQGPGADLLVVSGGDSTGVMLFGGGGINDYHVSGLTIADGMAGDGGGINMSDEDDSLHISGTVIRDNTSSSNGGGLHVANGGKVYVSNSSILDNQAGSGAGALLFNVGEALFSNVTFEGNIATLRGGGISNLASGDSASSTLTVLNSTFINNRSPQGAAIRARAQSGATDALTSYGNSVFTGNHDDANLLSIDATLNSLGGNVLDDNSGSTGDTVTTDTLVGDLVESGTMVAPLLPGTSAIDNAAIQNFATFGVARQSSIHSGRVGSLAIDGDPGTSNHTAASQDSGDHWWEVELPVDVAVSEVVLHNRLDCCASRLRDIRVDILDADGLTIYTSELLNPENGDFTYPDGPTSLTLDIAGDLGNPINGRIVRITRLRDDDLSGTNGQGADDDRATLQLGEVEVNGIPASDQRGAPRNYDGDFNGSHIGDSGAFEYSPIVVTTTIDEALAGDTLISPTSVTSSTVGTDLYPAAQLVDNSGFATTPNFGNYTTLVHDSGNSESRTWVTSDPGGFPSDYFASDAPAPTLTFELGDAALLSDIVLWGYLPSGNDARTLEIEFSLNGSSFGRQVTVEHAATGDGQETISLGQTVMADAVRVRIVDNYFGIDGRPGGDRVGLGEVKFLAHEGDGLCSLREAIAAANHDDIQGTADGECTVGGGTDTIIFADGIGPEIVLTAGELIISESVNILGPGANALTINADSNSRIFHVQGNVRSEIVGLTLTNGSAPGANGGAILNQGSLRVVDSRVTSSTARYGGGINNFGQGGSATLVLLRSEVSDNTATDNGGGVYNWGTGGEAVMEVTQSSIVNNEAGSLGGGGFNWQGNLSVKNSTFSGNTASDQGGALYATLAESRFVASTISANDAGTAAGGLAIAQGEIELAQTILAGNTAAQNPDVGGTFNSSGVVTSLGYNLIGSSFDALTTVSTDQLNVNPQLAPLSTDPKTGLLVHLPQADSPVIDAIPVADSQVSTDQRGVARPQEDDIDIGAVELEPSILSVDITETSISENGGTATATVSRTGDTSVSLSVTLESDDTSEGTVPIEVTIAAGETTSPAFTITGVDDAIVDGTQTVTVTASAAGTTSGSDTLDVTDDDSATAGLLDVDGDGLTATLTDGILIVRYLAGFTGSPLVTGAVNSTGDRTDAAAVIGWLDPHRTTFLDVNGDGTLSTLSDGILVLRYLAGFRGESLIAGAVTSTSTRTTSASVVEFLNQYLVGGGAQPSAVARGAVPSMPASTSTTELITAQDQLAAAITPDYSTSDLARGPVVTRDWRMKSNPDTEFHSMINSMVWHSSESTSAVDELDQLFADPLSLNI